MRHECNKLSNGKNWMYCSACDGRVHLPNCTSKRNKKVDCCWQRHLILFEEGHRQGLNDSSEPMLDEITLAEIRKACGEDWQVPDWEPGED